MKQSNIPTININIRHTTCWKTILLMGAVFAAGVLYGKISVIAKEETDGTENKEA